MSRPTASRFSDAPDVGIPNPPALFADTSSLWLSYETTTEHSYAIVKFVDVIDHWLSPINDEGLGQHPLHGAGLKFYAFHCVADSPGAKKWQSLGAKHWVVTFKDNTLDVLAVSVEVLERDLDARSASSALLDYLGTKRDA